ncbi:hypothetical protein JL720_6519 [Aureococcus anophagefferens]|nr:hypothetical protein JL720_6519 [Aureococcus anophagefferens]
MSEVEETLERVKIQAGVEGYVICSKQGQVLRRLPSMTQAQAEIYADFMSQLSRKARGVVRDLNPKNELRWRSRWSGPWDQEEQYFYELHEYESSDCRASSLFQTTYLRIGCCVDGRRGSLAVRRDGLVDWYAAPYCEGAPALADDPFFYDAVDGCVQSTALSWSNRVFGGAPDVYVRSSMAVLPRASVDASRLVGIEEWWPIPRLPGTRVYDYTAWSLGCDALPALYRAYEPRVCYKVFSALPGWMTNLYAPPDLWRAFECEGDELAERYFLDGACAGDPFRWDELNESTHDLLTWTSQMLGPADTCFTMADYMSHRNSGCGRPLSLDRSPFHYVDRGASRRRRRGDHLGRRRALALGAAVAAAALRRARARARARRRYGGASKTAPADDAGRCA